MHLPQEMTATMRYLDLTAEPKKLHLLGQQGKVERLATEQGRPGDGHDRLLGTAEHSNPSKAMVQYDNPSLSCPYGTAPSLTCLSMSVWRYEPLRSLYPWYPLRGRDN